MGELGQADYHKLDAISGLPSGAGCSLQSRILGYLQDIPSSNLPLVNIAVSEFVQSMFC